MNRILHALGQYLSYVIHPMGGSLFPFYMCRSGYEVHPMRGKRSLFFQYFRCVGVTICIQATSASYDPTHRRAITQSLHCISHAWERHLDHMIDPMGANIWFVCISFCMHQSDIWVLCDLPNGRVTRHPLYRPCRILNTQE